MGNILSRCLDLQLILKPLPEKAGACFFEMGFKSRTFHSLLSASTGLIRVALIVGNKAASMLITIRNKATRM